MVLSINFITTMVVAGSRLFFFFFSVVFHSFLQEFFSAGFWYFDFLVGKIGLNDYHLIFLIFWVLAACHPSMYLGFFVHVLSMELELFGIFILIFFIVL